MEERPSEQLDRQLRLLQQRNAEWARETARLLEDEVNQAQGPLRKEIDDLHLLIHELKQERDQLAGALEITEQVAERRMQALSEQINTNIQNLLGQSLTAPTEKPAISAPKIAERQAIPPIQSKDLPKPKIRKAVRVARTHHLVKPVATAATLMLVGYLSVTQVYKHLHASSDSGEVAGVSTQKLPPPAPEYPESHATVAFTDTEWATYSDSDFGVSLQYPKNATNLVHIVGGSNLWFLRGDGYLLKISKIDIDAGQSLDEWWNSNQTTYVSDSPASKSSFKNIPAWSLPSAEKTSTSGSQFFIKAGPEIYQIWIKDEPAATDDGKRLQQMVSSITITGS